MGNESVITRVSTYIVQHDGLEALLPESADSANGAPVEFNRRSDTVHTGTEHHDTLVVKANVMLLGVVCQVEIIGHSGELGGDCIDLLDDGEDTSINAHATHGKLVGGPELGKLAIGETQLLGLLQQRHSDADGVVARHRLLKVTKGLEAAEEPLVNLSHFPDLVNAVAGLHGVSDSE